MLLDLITSPRISASKNSSRTFFGYFHFLVVHVKLSGILVDKYINKMFKQQYPAYCF